jgi:cytochrome o ubiquinol oxidase subunit IV
MSTTVSDHDEHQLSLPKYIVGFVGSVVVTMAAYLLVTRGGLSQTATMWIISGLALVQFLVQMVFFLHIGDERRPRWKLTVALFMIGIVILVVVGSIWIMDNLNYRMMDMTQHQTEQYLHSQDSL